MNRVILLLCLSTLFRVSALPQDSCPILSIDGPAGIVDVGDIATYRASLDLKGSKVTPTFRWTVSVGEIVSGQGTNTIEVRQPKDGCITATVEVGGFPDSCPLVVSEMSCVHRPPEAVKIGEMRNIEKAGAVIKQFVAELESNPNNQGYILVGYPTGTTQPKMYAREQSVRDAVRKADPDNFDDSRITITAVESSANVVEFWRVPPGANNPTCRFCERLSEKACPTISVTSVTAPFENSEPLAKIRFHAVLGGNSKQDIRYVWLVSNGKIVEGQGTSVISVLPDRREGGVTATIEIDGFPKGCSTTATESSAIRDFPNPILIDEVDLPLTLVAERTLRLAAQEQKNNPTHSLYIIAYTEKDVSQFDLRQGVKKVTDFLIKATKLTGDDFQIVVERSERNVTKIYRLAPGADKPTP